MVWRLEEHGIAARFLIHDHDRKFTSLFDAVFASEQIHVIHTPYYALYANAYAEGWVRTVREECRDKIIVLNEAHLQSVLRDTSASITQSDPIGASGNRFRCQSHHLHLRG